MPDVVEGPAFHELLSTSERIAAQELAATLAFCGNHVTAGTLDDSGHGYPGNGRFHCACPDLQAVWRVN